MKINYSLTGAERKALVTAIGALLDITPHYKGGPNAIYEIDEYTVDKNGVLIGGDSVELVGNLKEQGFVPVSEEYEKDVADDEEIAPAEPETDTLAIEVKFENGYTDFTSKREILQNLIASKATLILAALGDDGIGALPVEFTEDGNVRFEWLKLGIAQEVLTSWTEFLCAAVKFAKKAQRITAKDADLSDNPKFDFRVFLVKIGLKGCEYKEVRKILLRNLSGSTGFKNAESHERWKAKHQKTAESAE